MRLFLFLCVLLSVSAARAETPQKLQVITSFSILEDMAKQIGGDRVVVKTLVGGNGDLHAFEPRPADVKLLQTSDLFIVNGLGLEGFVTRLVQSSNFKGDIVEASHGVVPIQYQDAEEIEEHGAFDPHAWQSLKNGRIYARNIATAFAAKDPQHQHYYNERLKGYLLRLQEIEDWALSRIKTIPKKYRSIVMPHNSFGYFARDYGFQVIAPHGLSTESEPAAKDVAAIVDAIRGKSVRAIFTENIAASPIITQVSQETGLPVGGQLYSDALSEKTGNAYTYLELFQWNVKAIVSAVRKQ